jgi:S1-C subfamily serine protease
MTETLNRPTATETEAVTIAGAATGGIGAVHLAVGGRTHRFVPGPIVTIGRDADSTVVLSSPSASRHHARLWFDGARWVLEDLGSSGGTHVGTQPVTRLALPAAATVWFGPIGQGDLATLSTEPAGRPGIAAGTPPVAPPGGRSTTPAAQRRSLPALVLAGLIAVSLLVAGVVTARSQPGPAIDSDADPELATDPVPTVERLRAATVLIDVGDGSGSGAVVSADGLILTNAHLVAPSALGQGVVRNDASFELPRDPDRINVFVSRGNDDEPAELAYEARVVAADGYLDLAVVQITKASSGKLVRPDELDLPHLELGDSEGIRLGAPITVLGFPGIARSQAVTLTNGTIGGFQIDDRIGDNRAFLNTGAPIAAGNSGGVAADEAGTLIGTPTLQLTSRDRTDSISVLRPAHLARPLLDQARAVRDEDAPTTTSPHVTALGGDEVLGDNLLVAPAARPGIEVRPDCSREERVTGINSRAVGVAIPFRGFSSGPVDVRVDIKRLGSGPGDPDVVVGSTTNVGTVTTSPLAASGCLVASVAIPDGLTIGTTHVIEVYAGGNYQPIANNGVFRLR